MEFAAAVNQVNSATQVVSMFAKLVRMMCRCNGNKWQIQLHWALTCKHNCCVRLSELRIKQKCAQQLLVDTTRIAAISHYKIVSLTVNLQLSECGSTMKHHLESSGHASPARMILSSGFATSSACCIQASHSFAHRSLAHRFDDPAAGYQHKAAVDVPAHIRELHSHKQAGQDRAQVVLKHHLMSQLSEETGGWKLSSLHASPWNSITCSLTR
jgi:hypothetical protein